MFRKFSDGSLPYLYGEVFADAMTAYEHDAAICPDSKVQPILKYMRS